MGTNYYLRRNVCETCKHVGEELHIGKSSMGWTFSFQALSEPFIHSEEDWRSELAKGGAIFDEYGESISHDEFWAKVDSKRKEKHNHARECPSEKTWIDRNGNSFRLHDFC